MSELAFKPATALCDDLAEGRVGCVDLLEHYLARTARYDEALNAIVVRDLDLDRARKQAAEADAALARGERWGPLHGLPMTVKESYGVAGLPTTWGMEHLAGQPGGETAVAVERLQAAGAVVFGKTNVPVLLGDWQSYNSIYGQTNNPWDVARTPGGSSGGSAAALAAGLTGLEAGSDIGGSIRVPAAFCGVYGLKPTWGVIPLRGHTPVPGMLTPADIAVVGPLARSADDLDLALGVMAGADGPEADGWQLALPAEPRQRFSDFRVAVWLDAGQVPLQAGVGAAIQQVADRLASLGASVSDQARPDVDPAEAWQLYVNLLYYVLGSRQPPDRVAEAAARYPALRVNDVSDEAMMDRGMMRPHREWLGDNEARNRLRWRWQAFFADWDLLLCPVFGTTAFPHDHSEPNESRQLLIDGEAHGYSEQLFWPGLTGVSYLPSVSAPIGHDADGLPIGMQIVAPAYHERRAIQFARLLADEIGGFTPPPGYAD